MEEVLIVSIVGGVSIDMSFVKVICGNIETRGNGIPKAMFDAFRLG